MIEEAIVHVGMHKTGSSSIQETLGKIQMKEVEYLSLGSVNHSGFLMTLLSDSPQNYHTHARSGRNAAQVQSLKEFYTQRLHTALKNTNTKRILISAEDLSRAGEGELEYLKEIILGYCQRIKVIGYVRSPVGFIQSAFQQRLKGGSNLTFNLQSCYPNYYKRFAKMDDVFGKDNVELVAFKKDSLHSGDVVQDFAHRIGVELLPEQIARTNEALSLEATALLYTFRRFTEKPAGYEEFSRDNNRLIAALSEVGDQKLVFADAAVASVLDDNREDIDWMSARLGQSILDQPGDSPQAIGSEADLLNIAYESRLALWELLEKAEPLNHDTTGLARLVDRLHTLHAREIPPLQSPYLTLFSREQMDEIASSTSDPASLLTALAEALTKSGEQSAARSVRNACKRVSNSSKRIVSRPATGGN